MTGFTITEDLPKRQVEFDARFNSEEARQDYLFKMKWHDEFVCHECDHNEYWLSASQLYICTPCETSHPLTADNVMPGTQNFIILV